MKIRGKTTPQHDLKGRMPERSEWLLAGGVQRSATLGIMPPIVMRLKYANITFPGGNIRFSYNVLAPVRTYIKAQHTKRRLAVRRLFVNGYFRYFYRFSII